MVKQMKQKGYKNIEIAKKLGLCKSAITLIIQRGDSNIIRRCI